MKLNNRFLRIGVAVAITGVISLQLPLTGGTALAADAGCGFVTGGSGSTGGGSGSGISGGALAVAGGAVIIGGIIAATGGGAGAGAGAAAILAAGTDQTIYGVLSSNAAGNQYSIIADLIQRAGLANQLGNGKEYTFFAPTNAALNSLPPGTLDNLKKPENKDQLIALIKRHIVDKKYTADQLANLPEGTELTTESGTKIKVNGIGGLFVDGIRVDTTQLSGNTGNVYGIGGVLSSSDR